MGTNFSKIRAVDRAFDIIESFSFKDPELTLVEISQRTGLALATVHRSIQTMLKRGYIEKDPNNGKYRLGMQFVKIGGIVVQNIDLIRIATPFLQQLSNKTEQNVNLSIYDRGEALCLVNIESFHNFNLAIKVGQRLPIYAGALSKVILSYLPQQEISSILSENLKAFTPQTIARKEILMEELNEIMHKGYSKSTGELALGVAALAAPIRDYANKVVAGIAISGPVHYFSEKNEKNFLKELLEAAREISSELGFNKVSDFIER